MNLITITLSESEQDVLLSMQDWTIGDNTPSGPEWNSIAGKIRRAREEVWDIADVLPEHPTCAICFLSRDVHPAFPSDDADHAFQWTKP